MSKIRVVVVVAIAMATAGTVRSDASVVQNKTPETGVAGNPVLRPSFIERVPLAYLVAAIDGRKVAFVADPNENSEQSEAYLAIWSGHGAVSLVKHHYAHEVAISGNRVYWSWTSRGCTPSGCGMVSELWTAVIPKLAPQRLLHIESSDPNTPGVTVAGDSSLVVYARGARLFRLREITAQMIRRERRAMTPLSVSNGRVLLHSGHSSLEVVDGVGTLLAHSSSPGPEYFVGARLSGSRVIVLTHRRILVYRLPSLGLRANWPVGAPGTAGRFAGAGIPYGPLFPYRTEDTRDYAGVRLLNVDTGRDVSQTLAPNVPLTTMGISQAGGFYTALRSSVGKHEVGLAPLSTLIASVRLSR